MKVSDLKWTEGVSLSAVAGVIFTVGIFYQRLTVAEDNVAKMDQKTADLPAVRQKVESIDKQLDKLDSKIDMQNQQQAQRFETVVKALAELRVPRK